MDITPYGKNAKKHPQKQVEQVAESIKEIGGVLKGRARIECVNCHVDFWSYLSNVRNKKFCSIKCKSDYSRIERECKNCKKGFSICLSTITSSNASGNYCSTECYYKSMRTGLIKSKNGFRGIVRRNFPKPQSCSRCGTTESIHIHHIEPYRYTQNNNLDNLIQLCNSCHKTVEIITETLLKVDTNQSRVFDMMKNMLRDRQQHTYALCK